MTPQQFSELITNREYPFRMSDAEIDLAKENSLCVLWGQSDDLLEVDGFCCDEVGAYDGTTCRLDKKGFLEINEDGTFQNDEPETIQQCRQWVERYDASIKVEAVWCPDTQLSWEIRASHSFDGAEFLVREDGEPMCKGLIIKFPD